MLFVEDSRPHNSSRISLANDRPHTSMERHAPSTDDDDAESHQGAYDMLRRVSIADTHL